MKDPGNVAQGRTHTRLARENRQRFRRIYADAPGDMSSTTRRSWALQQLSHEFPDRYREIYLEEKASLVASSGQLTIDPEKVAKASGSGPWHSVLTGGGMTACGRTRIQISAATADRQVNCSYCLEDQRERRGRDVDPQFGAHASAAEARIRGLADLHERAAAARIAALDSLSPLRTPPIGTSERERFADLLREARGAGLLLQEIGDQMGVSRERIRQLTADEGGEPDA